MEHCVSRRDAIVDGAMAKEKRNIKGQHNQRTVFKKRLDDQRLKIKQIARVRYYSLMFHQFLGGKVI